MDKFKDPHSILITGASSGIGAALARYYACPDRTLFLSARNEERLTAVAEDCRSAGAAVHTQILDVTDFDRMRSWIADCHESKALDLVIANAGISGGTGGMENTGFGESPAQVRQIFGINLTGVLNTIEPALPLMIDRGHGQFAVISSLASLSGWPGAPSYSASKGAVRLYGEALRGALAGSGIAVNIVLPGFIDTPMTAVNPYKMPFMISDEKAAQKIAAGLAKNRGRIAFPLPTYLCAGLLGILPYRISQILLAKFPAKPANTGVPVKHN